MNKVLFVYKDKAQKTVLQSIEYNITDNIVCEILTDYPKIEQKDGYYGYYALDDNGNVMVVYNESPKTEIDILREENEALQERLAFIQESDADNILLINELQLSLEELEEKINTLENGGIN